MRPPHSCSCRAARKGEKPCALRPRRRRRPHRIVRAPYSRLSLASHTGTTLWASTSWNATPPSAEPTWAGGPGDGAG
jgi:hypothetical protein